MKGFRYLDDVVTLQLQEGCIGCGRCEEVCPHRVFRLMDKRAEIRDRDLCIECGACAKNCPAGVISVDAGVGCASGLINEWLREHGLKRSGSDCCS